MYKKICGCLFFLGVIVLLPTTVVFAEDFQFSITLKRGSTNQDVLRLQEFLKTMPVVYPEGLVTGYFGPLTEKAIKRFQAKYGIEQVGIVGPKTRAQLNSLISTKVVGQQPQQPNVPAEPETKAVSKTRAISKQQSTASLANQFAALEKELLGAKTSGAYLAPAHYERIKSDLDLLRSQGYRTDEIERLHKIAVELSPHTSKVSVPVTAPCISNSNPELVADITDFPLIKKITAPGSPSFEGPKGHSFIWTGGQRVPIYAPAPAILDNGSYGADNIDSLAQYVLTFQVKEYCDFQFRFDHIDEPVAAIKAALPATPKIADSRGIPAITRVELKAGDLVGYTSGTRQAGNWDFGLYNMSKEGVLAGYGSYGMHKHAVCWVDFYTAEKLEKYRNLLEGPRIVCPF